MPLQVTLASTSNTVPAPGAGMGEQDAAAVRSRPHVLVLPSWVGSPECPLSDVFFREQAIGLQNQGVRVAYACVGQRSLRKLSPGKLRETHFQVTCGAEDGLWTLRQHAWNPLIQLRPGGLAWAWLCERLVRRYIRTAGRPDIIHAHCVFWAGHAAARIRRQYGIPFVLTEHSSAFPLGQVQGRKASDAARILLEAGRVLGVSSYLGKRLREFAPGGRISCVPNYIDTEFFSPRRESAGRPYAYVAVCNLVPLKRVDLLLRAFSRVCLAGHDAQLEIAGDGPDRRPLEELAAALHIAGRVRFLGEIGREGVRDAIGRAGALVLASTVETFGVVLIEALAMGVPVVSTDSGGPRDIVTPETGILVGEDTPEGLAAGMTEVFRRTYRSDAIRRYAERKFSPAAVANQLIDIYSEVLTER
jgi:glycosyltransferase involved in cell wall biosynthesis